MTHGRGNSGPGALVRCLLIGSWAGWLLASPCQARIDPWAGRPMAPWSIQQRTLSQYTSPRAGWQADYRLVLGPGARHAVLTASSVSARIEGWVSNTRVPGHQTPRLTQHRLEGTWLSRGEAEIVASAELTNRCRELSTMNVWRDQPGSTPLARLASGAATLGLDGAMPLIVGPGETIHVCIKLEHDHFLYDPYEPLFGVRTAHFVLGEAQFDDELQLDHVLTSARPVPAWPGFEPPPDRRDHHVFLTPPNSLRLSADTPGGASYRLSGPVRYDTLMKCRFFYRLTEDGTTTGQVRISQLKQGPALWRPLASGTREVSLTQEGRWVKVEQVFRTEPDATHLILEFRAAGTGGTLWIDDVRMEPLTQQQARLDP